MLLIYSKKNDLLKALTFITNIGLINCCFKKQTTFVLLFTKTKYITLLLIIKKIYIDLLVTKLCFL